MLSVSNSDAQRFPQGPKDSRVELPIQAIELLVLITKKIFRAVVISKIITCLYFVYIKTQLNT